MECHRYCYIKSIMLNYKGKILKRKKLYTTDNEIIDFRIF